MSNLYRDASGDQPAKKHVGVWDDRPRFLGMFSSYKIPPQKAGMPSIIGVGDHLVTCLCGAHEQHPRLLTVFGYVRVSHRLYTVSWPTWARI